MCAMRKPVKVIFGTMTFGWARTSTIVDSELAAKMIDTFFSAGHKDLDTSLIYSDGKAEKMLGEICPPVSRRGHLLGNLATKAGPWEFYNGPNDGMTIGTSGGLDPVELRAKIGASLDSLKRESVDLFYLSSPDVKTNIEDTLAVVNEAHQQGKIKAFGLSNYSAWEVTHIYHTCAAEGWVRPSVYQGMYNAITREVESDLVPCLRKLGIPLHAYHPLAGGLLTGKHKRDDEPMPGRFRDNKMYLDRFWKDAYFYAVQTLHEKCWDEGLSLTEASLRWLNNHSCLDGSKDDAIVIGASSMRQLYSILRGLAPMPPLKDSLLRDFDAAWVECKRECPAYARGHSGSALAKA